MSKNACGRQAVGAEVPLPSQGSASTRGIMEGDYGFCFSVSSADWFLQGILVPTQQVGAAARKVDGAKSAEEVFQSGTCPVGEENTQVKWKQVFDTTDSRMAIGAGTSFQGMLCIGWKAGESHCRPGQAQWIRQFIDGSRNQGGLSINKVVSY